MWVRILGEQRPLVAASAGFSSKRGAESVEIVGIQSSEPAHWETLLRSHIANWVAAAVNAHRPFKQLIDGGAFYEEYRSAYFLLAPVPGSNPPMALAVATRSHKLSLVLELLDSATLHAAFTIAVIRRGQEREIGYRQMAERVSYMCSSSILLAQYRLRALTARGQAAVAGKGSLEQIMRDLEEAQRGLDRARLFALPCAQDAELIPLGKLIDEILGAIKDLVPAHRSRGRWGDLDELAVRGSRMRLRYAFRDVFVLARSLGKRRITFELGRERDCIHIRVRGGRPTLRIPKGIAPIDFLCSPQTFLLADDDLSAERALGLQLARDLFKEAGGRLAARFEEGFLEFEVVLPVAIQKDERGPLE